MSLLENEAETNVDWGWLFRALKGKLFIANGQKEQGMAELMRSFNDSYNLRVFQWIAYEQVEIIYMFPAYFFRKKQTN